MKILYKQLEDVPSCSLDQFGVQNCYLKELSIERDCKRITKKLHHHTGFEIHIIIDGFQEYEICEKSYKLTAGSFLMIYPNVSHTVVSQGPHTKKYSITFHKQTDVNQRCVSGKYHERILENLLFVSNEAQQKKEISATLIENSILETLVCIFRLSGIKEKTSTRSDDENLIVALAKQYIKDNIETNPSVSDAAKHCYLSTRQLTRIFNSIEGISPGEYITKLRISKIEELIAESTVSLKQISDLMHFSNEYYFHAFFKKHFGMPPGEYRKMLGQ